MSGGSTGTGAGVGSIIGAFYKAYMKGGVNKGRKKIEEILVSLELDSKSLKEYLKEIKDALAGTLNDGEKISLEAFFSIASRDMKVKILKNLSEAEQGKLAAQSDYLGVEVMYLRFWISGEANMLSPKIRTFGELRKLCDENDIDIERTSVDSATLTSVETKGGVCFYLEAGDYKRGKRVVVVPVNMLYK